MERDPKLTERPTRSSDPIAARQNPAMMPIDTPYGVSPATSLQEGLWMPTRTSTQQPAPGTPPRQGAPQDMPSSPPPTHMSPTGARALSRSSSIADGRNHQVKGRRALNFRERQPFIIGVAGGTASGKTTVCDTIMKSLNDQCAVLISQDSFYRGLTEEEEANVNNYNFDHPAAFDEDLIVDTILALRRGEAVNVPVYDFATHQRHPTETVRVNPADVVVVEGILVLHMRRIRELCNMKVFVDTDDDVRLARRIKRDVSVRGRDVAGVIEQYTRFVKPSFDAFVAPSRRHADIIIPWGRGDNMVAVDLIVQHIRSKVEMPVLQRMYPSLQVIASNKQIRSMHTIIRNKDTSRNDFIFYADRLIRLLVEGALGFLPFQDRTVETPTGQLYVGVETDTKLCAVSLIRSGEAMEQAVRACAKGIKIGKILIHRQACDVDQEPLPPMVYEKLPHDIASRHVLLLDPILATGNSADRAIQVLLERGVPQDNILFLNLIATPQGIHNICSKYPEIKVITTEIDDGVDERGMIVPGVGEFGDRYFCN